MAHRAEDIRHDIANTRAAMTEKLAMLEERVRETVAGAQASAEEIVEDVGGIVKDVRGIVEDVGGIVKDVKTTVDTTLAAVRQGVAGAQASVEAIVENVQGTVEDTIATAQRTFDLPSQVEQHPWPMVGGALLVGYMLGSRGGGRTSAAGSTRDVQRTLRSSAAAAGDNKRHTGSIEGRNGEPQNHSCSSRDEHTTRDVHASPTDRGPTPR